jgi:hypothetical protein
MTTHRRSSGCDRLLSAWDDAFPVAAPHESGRVTSDVTAQRERVEMPLRDRFAEVNQVTGRPERPLNFRRRVRASSPPSGRLARPTWMRSQEIDAFGVVDTLTRT